MGFLSFLGRLLFASLFIISACQMYNEFGSDGGPAAKEMAPKLASFQRFLAAKLGKSGVNVDIRRFLAASIVLKGFGGILFVFGSSLGAYFLIFNQLLTIPLIYDFNNDYEFGETKSFQLFQELLQGVALFGALLFFLGMNNSVPRKQLKKKIPKAKAV